MIKKWYKYNELKENPVILSGTASSIWEEHTFYPTIGGIIYTTGKGIYEHPIFSYEATGDSAIILSGNITKAIGDYDGIGGMIISGGDVVTGVESDDHDYDSRGRAEISGELSRRIEEVEYGDCESTNSPTLDGGYTNLSGASWERTTDQVYNDSYSWVMTKISGAQSFVTLADSESTTDLHGIIPGKIYQIRVAIYTTVVTPSNCYFRIYEYYSSSWHATDLHPSASDTWQILSTDHTINASTTGFFIKLFTPITEAVGTKVYIDDFSISYIGEIELDLFATNNGQATVSGEVIANERSYTNDTISGGMVLSGGDIVTGVESDDHDYEGNGALISSGIVSEQIECITEVAVDTLVTSGDGLYEIEIEREGSYGAITSGGASLAAPEYIALATGFATTSGTSENQTEFTREVIGSTVVSGYAIHHMQTDDDDFYIPIELEQVTTTGLADLNFEIARDGSGSLTTSGTTGDGSDMFEINREIIPTTMLINGATEYECLCCFLYDSILPTIEEIEYGDCESTNSPTLDSGYSNLENATWERTTGQVYNGIYSWEFNVITSVNNAKIDLVDTKNESDMHGLETSCYYELNVALRTDEENFTELMFLEFQQYYDGAWHATENDRCRVNNPNSWETFTKIYYINPSTTGINISLEGYTSLSNKKLWIDSLSLIKMPLSGTIGDTLLDLTPDIILNTIITSGIIGQPEISNVIYSGTEHVEYGDCESTNSPTIDNGYSVLTGATWGRTSNDKHDGVYSWLLTKTTGAGGGYAYNAMSDTFNPSDMHGFIAGEEYYYSLWFKTDVDTLSNAKFQILEYSSEWTIPVARTVSTSDWTHFTGTFTIGSNTTGFSINVWMHTNELSGKKIYIDELTITNVNDIVFGESPLDLITDIIPETMLISGCSIHHMQTDDDDFYIPIVPASMTIDGNVDLDSFDIMRYNFIEHSDCESINSPTLDGGYSNAENATWTRSTDRVYEGNYSWELNKDSLPGAGSAIVYLTDNLNTSDMHGLEANTTYLLSVAMNSNASTPTNAKIYVLEYIEGWNIAATISSTIVNSWQYFSNIEFSIDAAATAISIQVYIATAEPLNTKLYIDKFSITSAAPKLIISGAADTEYET